MNLEKYLITENASILEAIEKININGSRFILIINHKKEVVGLATDGDIRRAILRKVSLNNNITNAMNKDFFFLNSKKDKIKDSDNYINFIPIIDIRTKKLKDILITEYKIKNIDLGFLDITFYRDDFGRKNKILSPNKTSIDFFIEDKSVILIDDVLYTGRSVTAALAALQSFGRPKKVELLSLVDRRFSRHLPIQPDYYGVKVDSINNQRVEVKWDKNNKEGSVYILQNEK